MCDKLKSCKNSNTVALLLIELRKIRFQLIIIIAQQIIMIELAEYDAYYN